MKLFKKITSFAILLFVSGLILGCGNADESDYMTRNVTVVKASRSDISQILSFSSTVEGNKETILSTQSAGQIANIGVDIGDEVSEGELLASLTAEIDKANYVVAKIANNSAEKLLQSAEKLLNQSIEDAKIGLLGAKENLEKASNDEEDQKNILKEELKNAELNYELAKINYENIKETTEQEGKNILDSAESAIVQAAVLSKGIVSYIYDINNKNYDAYDKNIVKEFFLDSSFSVQDSYKNEAENSIEKLMSSTIKLENYYEENIKNNEATDEQIKEGHELAKEAIYEAKNALQDMDAVLSHAHSNEILTDTVLSQYKSDLYSYAAQAESMTLSSSNGTVQGLIGIDQSISNLGITSQTALSQAEKQVEIAEQNIKVLSESMTATTNNLKSQTTLMDLFLKQSMNGLKTAEAQKENQMTVMQAQLDNAKSQIGLASAMLANTKLEAPYTGIISEKYIDEGSVVNAGTPVLKIADISKLKLIIFVPENQIKYFKIGQTGIASSESFPAEEFKTRIERISPKVETSSRKIRIELSIDDAEKMLKIGMYMKLKIELDSEEKVLAVPSEAIQDFYGEKIVFINKNGIAETRPVITGVTSENYTEILDGIEDGEEIIVKGITKLRDGDSIKIISEKEIDFIQPVKVWIEKI